VGATGPTGATGASGAPGAVTQIIAGTNITITPTNGIGAVTINSTGGGGGGSGGNINLDNLVAGNITANTITTTSASGVPSGNISGANYILANTVIAIQGVTTFGNIIGNAYTGATAYFSSNVVIDGISSNLVRKKATPFGSAKGTLVTMDTISAKLNASVLQITAVTGNTVIAWTTIESGPSVGNVANVTNGNNSVITNSGTGNANIGVWTTLTTKSGLSYTGDMVTAVVQDRTFQRIYRITAIQPTNTTGTVVIESIL
jgi:hypothetical protein